MRIGSVKVVEKAFTRFDPKQINIQGQVKTQSFKTKCLYCTQGLNL